MLRAKKLYLAVSLVLLCFSLCATALMSSSMGTSTAHAIENWTYLNDLSGSYTIQSADSNFLEKEFDIYGGATSTNDSNAPQIILYEASNPPQANHRFSFMPLEVIGGKTVYYITSAIDNNGRLDVQNGTFINNQPIWFYNQNDDSMNNAAQRWFVKTNDGGKTVQIELAADTRYVMGISSIKLNGYNTVRLVTNTESSSTMWKLNPIVGDFGLNTRTYVMDDNTGYASTANERWRYLSPLDNFNQSRISDIISVGIHGQGIKKTIYNGVTAFSVPYSSCFYLDTSFNFANPIYEDWTQNLPLGKAANSNGTYLDWMLSSDTYIFKTTSDNTEHEVGIGSILIELSSDNKTWEKYRMFSFTSSNKADTWEMDGEKLSSGVYVRVSYLFEIYCHWTTWKRDFLWWGHDEDHYEYKNVKEVAETFFVGVDGFSNGPDLGVVSVKNLTKSTSNGYEHEGFSKEDLKKAETLTNGSQTTTGFKIDSPYPSSAYKIEVSKDGGKFSAVSSGYSTTSSGRYEIRASSCFGNQKTITVYVCSEDITQAYFGVPFASKPNDEALIQGTRLFAGSNDYLKSVGVNPTYGWAQVPVYLQGCSFNIKNTSSLSSLMGTIMYKGVNGEKTIDVMPQKAAVSIPLQEAGFYTVNLSTSNTDGDVTCFAASFWVVENAIGPEINKQIFSLTHEAYDLLPVYYSVDMPRGPYTYIDNDGSTIEKQGVLRYAFSTYGAALDFSLRLQKEYAYRLDNGMFRYLNAESPNVLLSEFEVFDEMYREAKENVKVNYFSNSSSISMVGTNKKGIISDKGFVYYLGEESFDGDAKNAAPIVALNKAERDALTARRGFLNNFTFISMPLDSASVNLISSDGTEYKIAYDIPVEDQLKAAEAKSGIYTIVETSIFGIEARYSGVYIDESESNSIVVNLLLGSKEEKVTAIQNGASYRCKGGFTLVSAADMFDTHGLICVSHNRSETPIDIASLSNISFDQTGTYVVKVEDRFGRAYQFTIMVE